ncbi:MAG: helix-turn-helix domain-containing protein [Patescibacteria group bacterium]
MSHISTLQTLSLTEDEARTYLALLKFGGANAITLAKEVNLKRTTIYPILKSLHEKGFASTYFHKSKRLYRAEKPDKVAGQFEKRLELFNAIIPELKTIEKQTVSSIGLRFIETKQELERFYTGILIEYKGKSYSAIGSATAWEGINPEFFQKFRYDRADAKIKTRILLSADSLAASPEEEKLLREVRVLPKNHTFKSTMDIFDNKILIVNPDQTALAVVIEVPSMVDIFKEMFEILWKNQK